MTKVLVTGGAGYIGSHTCKALARLGHEVVVYDNLSTGHREFVKWGPLVQGDVRDTALLRATCRSFRPDCVIHFAASAYVGESVRDPGKYFSNNVCGTLSLLEAMRDSDVRSIVVSGTCAVYGWPDTPTITEETPAMPVNPYGASKLFMERMLKDFETAHGLSWVSLRYFNAAGCDPEGEIGERHFPETHLIPCALQTLFDPASTIDVFGDDYPTPDGTCIRDYVHVLDLAEAHAMALAYLQNAGQSMAMNLGTGSGYSVREILTRIESVIGLRPSWQMAKRRPGDPAALVADPSKARDVLGWCARYSGMDHILLTAWEWSLRERKLAFSCPEGR